MRNTKPVLPVSTDKQVIANTVPLKKINQQKQSITRKYSSNSINRTTNRKQNTTANVNREDEPLMIVMKHNGQYCIKMNHLPLGNANGKLEYPKDVDPVYMNLKRRSDVTLSSQSSIELELFLLN